MTDYRNPEVKALTDVIGRAVRQGRVHDFTLAEAVHDAGYRLVAPPQPELEVPVLRGIADGKRCPRCGTAAVMGRFDVCRPCAVAEGWEK